MTRMTRVARVWAWSAAPMALAALGAAPAVAQDAAAADTPGKSIPEKVSLNVLSQLPEMSRPAISPDGTMAVVTVASKGDRAYAVYDLSGSKAPPVLIATAGTYKDAGDRQITGYRWVGNDDVVLTLSSREDVNGYRIDVTRLVGFDLKTKKLTPVAWDNAMGQAADILDIDHKNHTVVLQRTSNAYGTERMFLPEVVRANVQTGKITDILQRPNPVVDSWFADNHGIVRGGFGSDSRSGKQRILYRSDEKGTMRTVSTNVDEDFTGDGIQPQMLLDEPDMAIVSSNKDGYSKLYKANLATMELGEPLFSVPGYDVGSVVSSWDGERVVGYTWTDDEGRVKWTEPKLAQIQQFLDESFGTNNASIVSRSEKLDRLIVHLGNASQPGAYYLYDVPTGNFGLLGYVNGSIKDGKLNPVSAMTYKASDGLPIQAIVTTPRGRVGQKDLPVVVLTHGGPFGARDDVSYDTWAQAIAEQGYVVVQPNYRGSGGYGRAFLKAGRDEGFGFRMQDDLNDAVTALAAKGLVDPKRACMIGWSYGGYAAARAAQRDPDKWRCAVAGAGVYDLPDMRDYDREYLGKFGSNYLTAGANDLISVSPARNAKDKWAPILIVHGVRDPRVPINQARTLVGRLRGSGKTEGRDFAYIEQPRNGHYANYFTEAEQLEWLKGATDWFQRFNPAYLPGETKP